MTTTQASTATSTLGSLSLVVATISTGLLAGVFYAYASSVMLALRQLDDRTFVDVMNRINVVIVNPAFMFSFLGSLVFTGIAAALHLRADQRTVLWWILAALVLNVISFLISAGGNIPLNNQLADVSGGDFAALRQQFEGSWVTLNILRGVANTAAVGALAWALRCAGRG
ncbi:putative membrane protein [Nocardia transvalensis]|uniref:Putative membrane protein n=1 Tax=Nocardia transvalensis TaxID=37333 RepID=A0A7W9PAP8_9NOCA|nr:anthrone oxygenase family protein [Nocardia transvalensis]MBB5912268.1 putative membrane protein [Nocardia transvalensis]